VSRFVSNTFQRPWLLYLVLGAIATGVCFLLSGAAQIGASAVIAILVGVRQHRPDPALPWYVIAFGLVFFVAGDVTFYNIYPSVFGVPAPIPSVADVFYASSYIIVTLGLALLIRSTGRRGGWGGLIDAAIIAIGVGLLWWLFVIDPYMDEETLPLLTRLVASHYPLLGVVWVALATRLLFASKVFRRGPITRIAGRFADGNSQS
jgi:hypothetical protein